MTSLQQQLERLASAPTDEYIQSKYKESFLYNRQDASAIDCDTHLRVANKGFDKLIESDIYLDEYRDLFDESSKTLERAVLTESDNQILSTRLRKFLNQAVLPYFSMSECHDVLEYLIYKYKINSYQIDDMLAVLLPYHDTRIFARAIQTVRHMKKKKGVWDWLISYQKEGLPVPIVKLVAIAASKNNFGLLSLLGDKLIQINKDCKNNASKYNSFFTSLMVLAIQKNTSDEFLTTLFPHVLKAMRKAYSLDLYMVSLTLSSYLAHQIRVENSFMERLMNTMTKTHRKLLMKLPEKREYLDSNYIRAIVVIISNQSGLDLTDEAKDVLDSIDLDKYDKEFDCSSVLDQMGQVIRMEE